MNPLRSLCEQAGFDVAGLAAGAGLPVHRVVRALSDAPAEPLGTYIKLVRVLGVRHVVRRVPLPAITFPAAALDALYYDNDWRKQQGLLAAPRVKGELRAMIRSMRNGRSSQGFQEIADAMERSFIPSPSGLRRWHRATVKQDLDGGAHRSDDAAEIVPSAEVVEAWRAYASAVLLVGLCPLDPGVVVGHMLGWDVTDGVFRLTAGTDRVPESVANAMRASRAARLSAPAAPPT